MNVLIKRHNIHLFLLITLFSFTHANAQSYDVTLESLLDEMTSFDAATYYPDYTCRQQSSYDRRSVTPSNMNWFANDDGGGFIRTETIDGRTEKVLFEASSPGAITRIWTTTGNLSGKIRFYFDGSTIPNWEIPAYNLLQFGVPVGSGLCQPHINNVVGGKGGSTFFLPITYAQSCKVTLEEPDASFSTPRYFHFNYRIYPPTKSIETFSMDVANRASEKMLSTSQILQNPVTFSGGTLVSNTSSISSNDSISIILPAGPNAVRTLQISISNFDSIQYAQLMRDLVLEAKFDGVKAVWVPLGDFSGGGMGAPFVKSWFLDANGLGQITSRWIMPYKTSGVIKIKNYSSENVTVSISANIDAYEWKNNSLYFHTSWKQQIGIPITNLWENAIDWNFSTLNGKGVYKGDVLSLYNHTQSWYGEGDEKIYIDNESFPSHFGTGTEDYYNTSWAPVVPFQTPFGGAPRADCENSAGYNTFFRTRNLDAIPFSTKLKFDIEMLSWTTGIADYSTTTFWYGDANSFAVGTSGVDEATRELLPEAKDPSQYTIPNSMEFETLTPVFKSPSISTETQNMTAFTGYKWSKGKQLLCRNSNINDYLEYKFIGYQQKIYRIQIQGTKAGDFGILSFTVNNGTPFNVDFYNNGVIHSGIISLGEYIPNNGEFTIRITYSGKNSKSSGNLFGLDCIQIIESDFNVQNAIEFEQYNFIDKSIFNGNFAQEMSFYQNGKWSNKKQMVFVGGDKGAYVDYSFNNLEADKTYDMTLYATKGPDFGILSFEVNGNILPYKYDGYHDLVSDSGPIELGEFKAKDDGTISFRVNVTSTNPFSVGSKYIVGLDCILLSKEIMTGATSNLMNKSPFYMIANKKLIIEYSKNISNISIYNMNGQVLLSSKTDKVFDLSIFQQGCYAIQLIADNVTLSDVFYL